MSDIKQEVAGTAVHARLQFIFQATVRPFVSEVQTLHRKVYFVGKPIFCGIKSLLICFWKKQTILALKSDIPLDISQKTKPFKLFSQMAFVWFHMWLYFPWYCKERDPWSENISWWQWRRTTQGSGPYMGRQGMSRGGERWRRCHIKI